MPDVKHTMQKMIFWSGGNAACRSMLTHKPRIVMLHKVSRDGAADPLRLTVSKLRAMLRAIARHYSPLRLKDFLELRQNSGASPKNAVVLTFDDGFKSFYELVFPLLREFNVPATVFVCPGLIDERSCIWPDRLAALYASGFKNRSGKNLQAMLAELKTMDAERRNEILNRAQMSLGCKFSADIPAEHQLMDWSMVREVSQSDLVEVGSHTLTHSGLAFEAPSVARSEIFESKARLEEELCLEIRTFCYPNGQLNDYTKEHTLMIEEANYSGAVAAHFGFVEADSDRFALPRIYGDSFATPYSFLWYLDGIDHMRHKLPRWITRPVHP